MSATIMWKPTAGGSQLDVGGSPSTFIGNIKKVFGSFPCTLGESDIVKLEVLGDLNSKDDYTDEGNPYKKLIALIEASGEIEVWVMD